MTKYNIVTTDLFRTAAESRDDFTRLLNGRGYVDTVVRMAFSRYSKAIEAIKEIGGSELEKSFDRWYMNVHNN